MHSGVIVGNALQNTDACDHVEPLVELGIRHVIVDDIEVTAEHSICPIISTIINRSHHKPTVPDQMLQCGSRSDIENPECLDARELLESEAKLDRSLIHTDKRLIFVFPPTNLLAVRVATSVHHRFQYGHLPPPYELNANRRKAAERCQKVTRLTRTAVQSAVDGGVGRQERRRTDDATAQPCAPAARCGMGPTGMASRDRQVFGSLKNWHGSRASVPAGVTQSSEPARNEFGMLINWESAFPEGGQITPMGAGSVGWPVREGVEIVTTQLVAEPDVVRGLLAILSSDERERASRFAFDRDRRRFIVARGRLRQLLAARLRVRPALVEFTYGAHGKPATAPRFAGSSLRFNVSHCGDLAVYAFAQGREVGVDVEAIRPMPDADGIAIRFFSQREREAYQALCPCGRQLAFFSCWTRKEAFIKSIGEGLNFPLDRINVSLAVNWAPMMLRLEDTPGDHRRWRLQSFFPAHGFVAAVVTEDRTAETLMQQ